MSQKIAAADWHAGDSVFCLLVITVSSVICLFQICLAGFFLLSAIAFMAFHGLSIGPACFLIPAEIFPLRVRGLGMGIAVAFNWGANVLVAGLVPIIIHTAGVAALFGLFFATTLVAWLIFLFIYPGNQRQTLEQIERNVSANLPCIQLGTPYDSTIKNKTALVTAAGQGIGQQQPLLLHRQVHASSHWISIPMHWKL